MIQSRGFYVSEKEVEEIVEKMDRNKDGRVSFAEVSIRCLRIWLLPTYCDDSQFYISYPCLSLKKALMTKYLSLPL